MSKSSRDDTARSPQQVMVTVINAFSKFAYAVPIQAKTSGKVARALEPILAANKIIFLQTENGK